jgi:hypothetical protein
MIEHNASRLAEDDENAMLHLYSQDPNVSVGVE